MRKWIVLMVTAVLVAACGSSTTTGSASPTPLSGTVNVFAAASLTAAFTDLGTSFSGINSGVTVKFNFAGTPTLVTQIEQGAPADVFASADPTNMDKLTGDGRHGHFKVFARNKLEIVVAPGQKNQWLADLAGRRDSSRHRPCRPANMRSRL
jgi:molybdate transport system substrate-binding protein